MIKKAIILLILLPLLSFEESKNDPKIIFDEMIQTCYNVKSLRYTQRKKERIEGELTTGEAVIKYQKKPFMVYMKQKSPKEGLEVLYIDGENNNNALINTNGFPWINVSLSPYGDRVRNGQHHTLFESGFYYFAGIVDHLITKYKKDKKRLLKYDGLVKYNNRICHKILVTNENFKYVQHKVEIRQSMLTIAKHYFINEYLTLEHNPDVDDYYDVELGDVITRPNDYAKAFTFLIDTERNIPLKISVFDEKGMFEQYEFLNLTLNPEIPIEEFNKEYKDYGF